MPEKKRKPRRKSAESMTTAEAARHLFGKRAADTLERVARGEHSDVLPERARPRRKPTGGT
jgi:hypothetical protein